MRRLLTSAVCVVLFALWSVPAGADVVHERYRVPTAGGAEIAVEVMRDEAVKRAPVLLTYSPYNTLSETNEGSLANDDLGRQFVPRGYARAVADVLGTRNSTGCWDYGGPKETQSGVDLVKWLARQGWSNGRVGMIGGSYDGTTRTWSRRRGRRCPSSKPSWPLRPT